MRVGWQDGHRSRNRTRVGVQTAGQGRGLDMAGCAHCRSGLSAACICLSYLSADEAAHPWHILLEICGRSHDTFASSYNTLDIKSLMISPAIQLIIEGAHRWCAIYIIMRKEKPLRANPGYFPLISLGLCPNKPCNSEDYCRALSINPLYTA